MAPPSALVAMPPSVPTYSRVGLASQWDRGLNTSAWWSKWILPRETLAKLAPPSTDTYSSRNPM